MNHDSDDLTAAVNDAFGETTFTDGPTVADRVGYDIQAAIVRFTAEHGELPQWREILLHGGELFAEGVELGRKMQGEGTPSFVLASLHNELTRMAVEFVITAHYAIQQQLI